MTGALSETTDRNDSDDASIEPISASSLIEAEKRGWCVRPDSNRLTTPIISRAWCNFGVKPTPYQSPQLGPSPHGSAPLWRPLGYVAR